MAEDRAQVDEIEKTSFQMLLFTLRVLLHAAVGS